MGGVVTCGCSLWTNLGECKRGRERVENKIFVKCFTLVLYIYIYFKYKFSINGIIFYKQIKM